jgi:hypothetical protein
MITTENHNGATVTVRWKRLRREDDAGDGHAYFYDAEGVDENGGLWVGSWMECDGENEIVYSELIENL